MQEATYLKFGCKICHLSSLHSLQILEAEIIQLSQFVPLISKLHVRHIIKNVVINILPDELFAQAPYCTSIQTISYTYVILINLFDAAYTK